MNRVQAVVELPSQAWAGITAVVGGGLGVLAKRKGAKAETEFTSVAAAAAVTTSALAVVGELQEELRNKERRIQQLEDRIDALEKRCREYEKRGFPDGA